MFMYGRNYHTIIIILQIKKMTSQIMEPIICVKSLKDFCWCIHSFIDINIYDHILTRTEGPEFHQKIIVDSQAGARLYGGRSGRAGPRSSGWRQRQSPIAASLPSGSRLGEVPGSRGLWRAAMGGVGGKKKKEN